MSAVILTLGFLYFARRGAPQPPHVPTAGLDPAVASHIEQYRKQVDSDPRSATAWASLGYVLRNYGFAPQANSCFEQAEQLDPGNARWPYFQSLFLTTEAPQRALAKNRRAVDLCGSDPEAPRLRLALLLAESGAWSEAEKEARELLRAKPDFTPALLLSARRAEARGKFDEAIALARQCTEDPRTARTAALLLATLYSRSGDMSGAEKMMSVSRRLPSDEIVADPYQAEAALSRRDPRALTEQAHPLLAEGKAREAEVLIKRLVGDYPNLPDTWLLSGRLNLIKKNYAAAEELLRKHLALDPQSSQGWFQLGLAQLSQSHFGEASASFQKATQLKPDFGAAFYNRGLALVRSGALNEAIPAFEQAMRLNPERIDSYLMLAECSLRTRNKNRAAQALSQAESLNPLHPALDQLRKRIEH